MTLEALWEAARTLGPGGTAIGFALWWDERRERRQIQAHVARLHRDNTKRLEKILKKLNVFDRVPAVPALITAKSGRKNPRGTG